MGVERALVSKVIIVLVAMWSPVDFYVFTEPRFETKQQCVEYVLVNHMSLNKHLYEIYGGEMKPNSYYCVESETLKRVLGEHNKPKI